CMSEYMLECLDDSRLIFSLIVRDTKILTLRLLYPDSGPSMSRQDYSCWSACLDAPALAPSNPPPSLAQTALPPPSIVLDSGTSTPDWPCWSACLDAPALTP